ncbi:hypothetical protein DWV29_24545 [Enterocloster asparagiformis]|uniref:Uncharacterized protein n=2 Tax=Enterocloster asparagiformis TaxID=333367 RepID=C0CTV6_9FIRM|nr:hypothetical protein CLOSTASPAR_00406 [[Clostridium] asparagiforme DSM 15981]RGX23728.1 hypothetical protein DWV29_24545 [Enterocloster asparagiformis]
MITIKTIRPAPDLLLDLLLRLLIFRSFLMTGIISSLPFIIAHVKGKVNRDFQVPGPSGRTFNFHNKGPMQYI